MTQGYTQSGKQIILVIVMNNEKELCESGGFEYLQYVFRNAGL